jgi:hypothetical protein
MLDFELPSLDDVAPVEADAAADSLVCDHALMDAKMINAPPVNLSVLIEFITRSSIGESGLDRLKILKCRGYADSCADEQALAAAFGPR